ncbi:MAG: hypothetical protein ACFCUU_16205 [Cyclobacteriaceae bacterium]
MKILSFNTDYLANTSSNKDVLSVFKQQPEKSLTIRQGMSVDEISDVVSEKVIAIVKEQFQATKEQYESKVAKK